MITSSPCFQLTGVATLCLAVSCSESITPLEPMKRLTEHLGGPRLWVKREDAAGVGFGGNKLRKLDYVLHEAMAGKADTLVSDGVVQSNSQLQVAADRRQTGPAMSSGCLSRPALTTDARV